jgi:hypothetical protein
MSYNAVPKTPPIGYVLVSLYPGTADGPCSFSGLAELRFPSFTRATQ